MNEVNLSKLKSQIPERAFDHEHAKNGLFSIAYPAGRARSLWNLTIALQDAEVDNFEAAYRIAEESHDLAHLCGLHEFRWKKTKWHELRFFLSFVYYLDNVASLRLGLKSYIEHLCENSRAVWGNSSKPLGLLLNPETFGVEVANTYLPWRTPEWFRQRIKTRPRSCYEPLSEFYPYIAKNPTEEHDLLLAVDRAVGKRLAPEWRSDFCQDLLVSILAGELSADNLNNEIPNYLVRFKREMPSKYKQISLDALIHSEDGGKGMTYGDKLLAVKPEEDLTDEDLRPIRWTGNYGSSLNDCVSTEDLAERLRDAWAVNRLDERERLSYSSFSSPDEETKTAIRELRSVRARYGLDKASGKALPYETYDERMRSWSSEIEDREI